MHPNPVFHSKDARADIAAARERGFGLLTVSGFPLPLVAHVPFLLSEDGTLAELHLVRSNPVARAVPGTGAARLVVVGPDAYVSPDWYGVPDQVPTWNYVAIHLTGRLERRPEAEMHAMLERQSADFEERLAPKPVWTLDKMTEETRTRFLRMIVPYRFHVEEVAATWKLGQNKPDPVRHAAASQVAEGGIGLDAAALGALMERPPRS